METRVTLLVALEDIDLLGPYEHYERPTGLCFELLKTYHFNFASPIARVVSCAVRFPEFGIASR